MRSVRAAVVSRTGIEIKPKVRCPFQTVEAMQKLLCKSFPGSRVPKPDRPDSLPTCKVSRAGAKKARRCVREATKEEWTRREIGRGWGVSQVWQAKDLREGVFGSVAKKGVSCGFRGCVANKRLRNSGERRAACGWREVEKRLYPPLHGKVCGSG